MPPSSSLQDPFMDAPLRPTSVNPVSNAAVRSQSSQHSLRSNASTASSRARQPRDLFAPSLSRRPTGRTTPKLGHEVFADSDPDRQRQGSPNRRPDRLSSRREEEEEDVASDIVNRGPNGNYLSSALQFHEGPLQQVIESDELTEEGRQADLDASYVEAGRQYFASKMPSGGRVCDARRRDDDDVHAEMNFRLREIAMAKLDEDRWRYEPVDVPRTAF